jgi:hypothetical protein
MSKLALRQLLRRRVQDTCTLSNQEILCIPFQCLRKLRQTLCSIAMVSPMRALGSQQTVHFVSEPSVTSTFYRLMKLALELLLPLTYQRCSFYHGILILILFVQTSIFLLIVQFASLIRSGISPYLSTPLEIQLWLQLQRRVPSTSCILLLKLMNPRPQPTNVGPDTTTDCGMYYESEQALPNTLCLRVY